MGSEDLRMRFWENLKPSSVYKVLVLPAAIGDLEEYANRIARESPERAYKWFTEAQALILSLDMMPRRFAAIPEAANFDEDIRDVLHHFHRIVYVVRDETMTVQVIRVWHVARRDFRPTDI